MLHTFAWIDLLEAPAYPPCWIAGLLGGLVTRRWPVAAALGFVVAIALDAAGTFAFSDAPPHLYWSSSLIFGAVGGLLAVVVWSIVRAVRGRRRQA
jgi:hypothetical protein